MMTKSLRGRDAIPPDAAAVIFNRDGTYDIMLPMELDGKRNYAMPDAYLTAAALFLTLRREPTVCRCALAKIRDLVSFLRVKASDGAINVEDESVH